MFAKRVARYALLAGTILIGVAYGSAFRTGGAPEWAPWLLATGIPISSVGIMMMGALRERASIGRLAVPFAIVAILLTAGFTLALGLPATENAASPLFLGLPLRAAIVVYGIGLVPILILPVAYALTFNTQTLSEEDVQKARALGAAYRKAD